MRSNLTCEASELASYSASDTGIIQPVCIPGAQVSVVGYHEDMSSSLLVGALNIVTNIAYLISADLTFQRRIYAAAAWFIIVPLISAFYHACANLDICFGIEPVLLQRLDHTAANIAVAQSFLILANYDLLRQSDARLERPDKASIYHARAMSKKYKYVLVKTRFADFASAFYTAMVILATQIAFQTPWEFVIVFATGTAIVTLSYTLHWRLKILGFRKRFIWKPLVLAALLGAISGVLFFLPDETSDLLHPLWHLTSAYSAALIIYGTTRHLRVFSLSSLISRAT